ncbi:MAG TPA: tRNA (adenosine(37)-N6)-threonylcarbamoyltransferase complex dimerization subunit type 1 TsaB [Candidatus Sulfotelmatobacter sp.]|jgi:tRNA threonylcarbamoyladenosine biosynthesis protein TsaB|nr:tRNA (adenosine(37)-N6)-threonylcarbamoyltransferase complex dimerization subunit type 1 TsaB [Candidatus Sulfotelmatobacter sp.]
MKKVILIIDTTNNKEMTVGLRIDNKEIIKKQSLDTRKAQVVLPMLEGLLKTHKLNLKEITAIEVNPGPGSFTGIRVGLSIANTLGFLLHIPVNENKVGESVEAIY